ncbi:YkgJ family cysteine cluster protein [Terriglobus albidus]|uniref:YkgJ family cysteine cluster protein n=1 Tax=Terriglobus albidus TaxID=1592106 RepID=A0A5B9EGT3_9BACT|nr:YkgJ family cysteine cluster protein [Terriglobus albidus]QEE29547.1 YkgJ family cysteine cluster protein [Terriglobus albidus]
MTDQDLIQITTAALASSAERAGQHLACHPGCHQCCIGVFPISQLDAHRLRLAYEASPKRAVIHARVQDAIARLSPDFPGDPATGLLDPDDPTFEDFANDEPCPVLDPVTGTCDLYEARPIPCRTFGPPMRTEDDGLAVCELCFTTATPEEIAAAEVDPTFLSLEEELNAQYEEKAGKHGPTLIAWALRE